VLWTSAVSGIPSLACARFSWERGFHCDIYTDTSLHTWPEKCCDCGLRIFNWFVIAASKTLGLGVIHDTFAFNGSCSMYCAWCILRCLLANWSKHFCNWVTQTNRTIAVPTAFYSFDSVHDNIIALRTLAPNPGNVAWKSSSTRWHWTDLYIGWYMTREWLGEIDLAIAFGVMSLTGPDRKSVHNACLLCTARVLPGRFGASMQPTQVSPLLCRWRSGCWGWGLRCK